MGFQFGETFKPKKRGGTAKISNFWLHSFGQDIDTRECPTFGVPETAMQVVTTCTIFDGSWASVMRTTGVSLVDK